MKMAEIDEEEDLLKSSDSEDDTTVKEGGNIKEESDEHKVDSDKSLSSEAFNMKNNDDDDFFKEIDDILETEPENYVSLKEDSSNSSSYHTANESLDSNKKVQGVTSQIQPVDGPSIITGHALSPTKNNEKPSPSSVFTIDILKRGEKRTRDTLEDEFSLEDLVNKKNKCDTSLSSMTPPSDFPNAQSTPKRASTTTSDNNQNVLLTSVTSSIDRDFEPDYSLLDDDEDEPTFHTLTLDQFLELDYSILEDEENDENSVLNQTVIEKQPDQEKDDTIKDDTEGSDSKVVPAKNIEVKPTPAKTKVDQSYKIKQEYYQKAKEEWKKDMANSGIQFHIPPIGFFTPPQVFTDYRDKKKIIGYESVGEWKDKYHPMWDEYRQCPKVELCHLIYRKWGLEKTIDITRNLTKFSNRSITKSAAKSNKSSGGKSKSASSKQVPDTCNETKVIENANIMDVMLESVRNEQCEDSELDPALADANSDPESETAADTSSLSNASLAGCKYCTFRCHCSPGRRLKRPYPKNCPSYNDNELKSNQQKLLQLVDVQKEVRNYKTTRMNNEESEARLNMFDVVEAYASEAKDVMFSSHEVFDLANYFNNWADSSPENQTNFTREQVRELLSVENTQDTLRKVYKSAYGGQGYSESEDSDSSESDSELGSVEGDEDKEWTDRQIEDY